MLKSLFKKAVSLFTAAVILAVTLTSVPTAFAQEGGVWSVWDGSTRDYDWEGEGTQENPYLIKSAAELAGMERDYTSGQRYYFRLETDIDLDNHNWTPIGRNRNTTNLLSGEFDGNGHVIKNLSITASDVGSYKSVGLFGTVEKVVFKNLGIENVKIVLLPDITANTHAGALIGYTTIEDGDFENAKVINCYAVNVDIEIQSSLATNIRVSGLVGYKGHFLQNCYTRNVYIHKTEDLLAVKGPWFAGVGGMENKGVKNCYTANFNSNFNGYVSTEAKSASNYNRFSPITNIRKFANFIDCFYTLASDCIYHETTTQELIEANVYGADSDKYIYTATQVNDTQLKALPAGLNSQNGYMLSPAEYINDGYPILNWQGDTIHEINAGDGLTVSPGSIMRRGDTVTVSSSEGTLLAIAVNGEYILADENGEFTFIMPDTDVTVEGVFGPSEIGIIGAVLKNGSGDKIDLDMGAITSELAGGGTVVLESVLFADVSSEPGAKVMYIAFYDGKELIDVKVQNVTNAAGEFVPFNIPITSSLLEKCDGVKAFLWNPNMVPYCAAYEPF